MDKFWLELEQKIAVFSKYFSIAFTFGFNKISFHLEPKSSGSLEFQLTSLVKRLEKDLGLISLSLLIQVF